jgi:hypothetical protein
MSRIIEELERQNIQVTYDNIAIYAVFVSNEGLAEKLKLNNSEECLHGTELGWLHSLFIE